MSSMPVADDNVSDVRTCMGAQFLLRIALLISQNTETGCSRILNSCIRKKVNIKGFDNILKYLNIFHAKKLVSGD